MWETMAMVSLFLVLAAVLIPLTTSLLGAGRRQTADPGTSVDRAAWEWRRHGDRSWQLDGDALILGGARLQSLESGIALDGELRLRNARLDWQRLEGQGLRVQLQAEERPPLIWHHSPAAEAAKAEAP
ncbi:MAG: hypothetical protein EA402_13765 [Planctomycetota bacterium]|nr:MAG: hypothetical protein EA402_13765 [Planctomycetota bacterium]